MKRRKFITLLGGAAAWPLAARAQQAAVPVIGLVNAGSREASASRVAAFRKGLSETGYVEGQNVAVEYHWLGGGYDRLPTLMADLVGRRVAVIATPGSTVAASAAKTATTAIPIVFGVGEDPVTLGLVSSLARPGGNATGINIFIWEVSAKRLALLHELAPRAVRVAVVINPGNVPSAEATLRELPEAARAIGLQIQILNARTSREIEAAFATLSRDRADALVVAPDAFFISRRVQFATLAARLGIPTAYARSGRLQVDDEFEFGGLHDGKLGGLRALEDLTSVEADLTPRVRNIDPIAHQSAGFDFVSAASQQWRRTQQCSRRGRSDGLEGRHRALPDQRLRLFEIECRIRGSFR